MTNAILNRSKGSLLAVVLGLLVAAPAAAQVQVTEAWVGAAAAGQKVAPVYLTLTNSSDDERKLMKVVSPVSDAVLVHRTSLDNTGALRHWPVAVLAVEPGSTLKMETYGLHVSFTALKQPLVAGQKVPLTLKFDGGQPEFTLLVEVRATQPPAAQQARR